MMKYYVNILFLLLIFNINLFSNNKIEVNKIKVLNFYSNLYIYNYLNSSNNIEILEDYLNFYNLNFDNVYHELGYFNSITDKNIFYHYFIPPYYNKVVILLHGYLDHSSLLGPLIKYLLERNYLVTVFDLPGHGFSDGERSFINDFAEYGIIFREFLNNVRMKFNSSIIFIGHSTGCAVFLEYLYQERTNNNYYIEDKFDNIIFLAPLIRSAFWEISQIGNFLFGWLLPVVPRRFAGSTSNEEFQKFIKYYDPLQSYFSSTGWVKSFFNWNNKIENMEYKFGNLKIIQGTDDTVVDWKFNVEFLKSRFTNISITYITNCKHHLINEDPKYTKIVFDEIIKYINNSSTNK